jgi:hypothetical protein
MNCWGFEIHGWEMGVEHKLQACSLRMLCLATAFMHLLNPVRV